MRYEDTFTPRGIPHMFATVHMEGEIFSGELLPELFYTLLLVLMRVQLRGSKLVAIYLYLA